LQYDLRRHHNRIFALLIPDEPIDRPPDQVAVLKFLLLEAKLTDSNRPPCPFIVITTFTDLPP
jgi:hypothetical protein